MIEIQITGTSMERIAIDITRFQESLDMLPLAEDIETFLRSDNKAARALGLDVEDKPLKELAPITIKTRHGDPFAEPMIPHYDLSRVSQDFETHSTSLDDGDAVVTGAWPNTPFLYLHVSGYTSRGGNPVPARNIVGIRPSARLTIARMLFDWVESKVESDDA